MFCYQCGSQIYNGISKCPFCQAPMEPANEIIYDSMVSKITPFCPRFVPGEKTGFKLGDHTLSVCAEQSFILALNHFIDLIFENSWNELAGWIRHMSFGGIVQKGKDKLGSLADGIALATAAFMNGAGCVVDSRTVEENFGFLWNVSHIMEPVYEIARNFSDTREAVNQALKSGGWAPRTSRWIGGGFGLGGAITGAVTAGAMNMVGNAMHSTKNAAKSQILKWYTNNTLSKGQDAIKESEEFLLGFRTAWQDHIVRLHRALKSVISEKCGFSDLQSPYDWGDELPFTFSVLNEQDALEALSHNVYDINAYVNLYSAHRELGRELCDLAEQCGILKEVGNAFVQQVDVRVINEELISMLINLEADFWEHVQNMTPPPLDGSDASARFLAERFPNSVPASKIELPPTADSILAQYENACEQLEAVTERKQEAENRLKEMLGDNEVGTANGRIVTWKSIVQDRLDSKTLKAEHPTIYQKYINKISYRRFSVRAAV